MGTPINVQAIPAKLPSGQWGARTTASVCKGTIITITTRAGKSWDAEVTGVLPGGLLETAAPASKGKRTRRAVRHPSRGCGYPGCNGRNYCDECTD